MRLILSGNGTKIHIADEFNGIIIGTSCGAGNQGISTRHKSNFIECHNLTIPTCKKCLKLLED